MTDVEEALKVLALPGRNYDDDGRREAHRLAGVLLSFLGQEVELFVDERRGEPIAAVFSCDGTPLSTTKTYVSKVLGSRVVRTGKCAEEFCVSRSFWVDSHGRRLVGFAPPAALTDKTTWSHFSALRQVARYPAELYHKGLSLVHHVFDRALFSSREKNDWRICARGSQQRDVVITMCMGACATDFHHTW